MLLGFQIGPSTFSSSSSFFFANFDFFLYFDFLKKQALSTSTQMRKINNFENDALKVERIQKTFKI
jgi:hypothetical protein